MRALCSAARNGLCASMRIAFFVGAWLSLAICGASAGTLRGVNLSGAELGSGSLPGREGTDYIYPDTATLKYFAGHGMTVVRLPVLWERLQPTLGYALDIAELAHVDDTIARARALGLRVIVDIHDYGMWRGRAVGSAAVPRAAFAGFWALLARHFRTAPGAGAVIFGLMNEPHDIEATAWAGDEQAAIDAIRQTGAGNLILVSGVGWDGAHNFLSGDGYGTPNALALAPLRDPGGNFAFEVHQYLDDAFSGTHADCLDPTRARQTLMPVTDWLRQQHARGFLGEFAATGDARCLASLNAMLDVLDKNHDVWMGWTYWAGGPWWGNYMFSVQPRNGSDRPQMGVLLRHLGSGS